MSQADQTRSAATERTPPATTSFLWCPVCGRDDRHAPLGGKYHYTPNGRCAGKPMRAVYELSEVRDA